jgi:tetratricopeptide (TPR) repeat protein
MNIQETILLASQAHQAGDLRQAEALYRDILAQDPNHPYALNLMGVLAHQTGRGDEALDFISRAIEHSLTTASFHFNLGLVLADMNRLPEAIAADRRAIALNPNFAAAYNNLANVLARTGSTNEAIDCFRRAIKLAPQSPDAPYNLANVLKSLGQTDEAITEYRRALSLRSQWPQAYTGLADALCIAAHFDEAAQISRRLLELTPDKAEAHNDLGIALCGLGQYDDGILSYKKSLALRPDYADACNNLANAYQCTGRFEQAVAAYEKALALGVDYASAHWNIGLIHLMKGEYEQGWPEYEWRLRVKNPHRRDFTQPRWDGGDLHGKRILLHSEQAAGDAIQFFRYIPLIAARGGKITIACQPELRRLFSLQRGIENCVELTAPSLPPFDVQLALGSLPGVFRTIPANVPYLSPDLAGVEKWKSRVTAAAGNKRKIGLAWAGRRQPDPFRSVPPELFAVFAATPGTWFCSLQKGPSEKQPPLELHLTDWTADLADFADTAALIANLDLVITIDTAVAHLAGALGKPTWLLVKAFPDWRWMLERTDSPWYPTMRLFRQSRPQQWDVPLQNIAAALRDFDRAP